MHLFISLGGTVFISTVFFKTIVFTLNQVMISYLMTVPIALFSFPFSDHIPTHCGHLKRCSDVQCLGLNPVVQHAVQRAQGRACLCGSVLTYTRSLLIVCACQSFFHSDSLLLCLWHPFFPNHILLSLFFSRLLAPTCLPLCVYFHSLSLSQSCLHLFFSYDTRCLCISSHFCPLLLPSLTDTYNECPLTFVFISHTNVCLYFWVHHPSSCFCQYNSIQ